MFSPAHKTEKNSDGCRPFAWSFGPAENFDSVKRICGFGRPIEYSYRAGV